jgi:hypothetical protein
MTTMLSKLVINPDFMKAMHRSAQLSITTIDPHNSAGTFGEPCPTEKGVLHFAGVSTCVFCFEKHRADVRAWWKANGVDLA